MSFPSSTPKPLDFSRISKADELQTYTPRDTPTPNQEVKRSGTPHIIDPQSWTGHQRTTSVVFKPISVHSTSPFSPGRGSLLGQALRQKGPSSHARTASQHVMRTTIVSTTLSASFTPVEQKGSLAHARTSSVTGTTRMSFNASPTPDHPHFSVDLEVDSLPGSVLPTPMLRQHQFSFSFPKAKMPRRKSEDLIGQRFSRYADALEDFHDGLPKLVQLTPPEQHFTYLQQKERWNSVYTLKNTTLSLEDAEFHIIRAAQVGVCWGYGELWCPPIKRRGMSSTDFGLFSAFSAGLMSSVPPTPSSLRSRPSSQAIKFGPTARHQRQFSVENWKEHRESFKECIHSARASQAASRSASRTPSRMATPRYPVVGEGELVMGNFIKSRTITPPPRDHSLSPGLKLFTQLKDELLQKESGIPFNPYQNWRENKEWIFLYDFPEPYLRMIFELCEKIGEKQLRGQEKLNFEFIPADSLERELLIKDCVEAIEFIRQSLAEEDILVFYALIAVGEKIQHEQTAQTKATRSAESPRDEEKSSSDSEGELFTQNPAGDGPRHRRLAHFRTISLSKVSEAQLREEESVFELPGTVHESPLPTARESLVTMSSPQAGAVEEQYQAARKSQAQGSTVSLGVMEIEFDDEAEKQKRKTDGCYIL